MTDKPDKPENLASGAGDEREAALLSGLAALPRAIQPQRDPWQQISRRIMAEQAGKAAAGRDPVFAGRSWWAVAASVLLLAVSALFLVQSPGFRDPARQPVMEVAEGQAGPQTGATAQQPQAAPEPKSWAPLPASLAELEYQAAFREFVRLDLSQPAVSPKAREAMLQDWALMRQLEQDLLAALEQEPDSTLLQDRWMQLRASQLQLLHVIAETGQWPGRTPI